MTARKTPTLLTPFILCLSLFLAITVRIMLITTIITISISIVLVDENILDYCFMPRFNEQLAPITDIPKGNQYHLFDISRFYFATVLITYVLLSVRPMKTISEVLYLFAWFFSTLNIVEGLKYYISDTICNKHANSVSGHSHLFVFVNMALWQLYEHEIFAKRKFYRIARYLSLGSSLFCLSETLLYGYHSPRQMLYGAGVALLSYTYQDLAWTLSEINSLLLLWAVWLASFVLRISFDIRSPVMWLSQSLGLAVLASLQLWFFGRDKPTLVLLGDENEA
jgi:hypothetical protein